MESTTNELKKIILVDDDEDLLYTFNYWLMNKGFVTIALTDASNIQSFIDQFHPALILIDMHLKDQDGRDVCRYLKDELHFTKPVLLYSAHDYSKYDLRQCKANGFLLKSTDHLSMIRFISQYL